MEIKPTSVITYFFDWLFILMIALSIGSLLLKGSIFSRAVLYFRLPFLNLEPHAYKIIVWSLFSLLLLRQRYKYKYPLAFLFYYALSETIGNSYYALFHQYWYEFAQPGLLSAFLIFPVMMALSFLLIKPKIGINKYIIPFVCIIVLWSLLGYHVEFDVCCSAIPASSPLYQVPPYTEVLDAMWLFAYLFWIYGCIILREPRPKSLSSARPVKRTDTRVRR